MNTSRRQHFCARGWGCFLHEAGDSGGIVRREGCIAKTEIHAGYASAENTKKLIPPLDILRKWRYNRFKFQKQTDEQE